MKHAGSDWEHQRLSRPEPVKALLTGPCQQVYVWPHTSKTQLAASTKCYQYLSVQCNRWWQPQADSVCGGCCRRQEGIADYRLAAQLLAAGGEAAKAEAINKDITQLEAET